MGTKIVYADALRLSSTIEPALGLWESVIFYGILRTKGPWLSHVRCEFESNVDFSRLGQIERGASRELQDELHIHTNVSGFFWVAFVIMKLRSEILLHAN